MESEFQVTEAKPVLKEALQAEVGLPVNVDIPVLSFVGRLEEQKGPDILVAAVEKIIDEDVQIIILVRSVNWVSIIIYDECRWSC